MFRVVAVAVAVTVVAVACGTGQEPAVGTSGTPGPTMSTAASSVPATTAPATVAPATVMPATSAPATSVPGPATVEISVSVGTATGPDRREVVALGDTVVLRLVNPQADDEFHLHGYDLGDGAEVPAGQEVTFTFTADTPGDFELESHFTHDVIMILEVRG